MNDAPMKLLLVGPYPPPHGGISVHVATAHQLLTRSGACCHVLDAGGHRERRGGLSGLVGSLRSGLRLLARVRAHARRGWTLHLHTNGHNAKSWLVAVACAAAARGAPARVLTVHSGMAPEYLRSGGGWGRGLARRALASYDRVLCVNPEIRDAARELGAPAERLEVVPAYLPAPPPDGELPARFREWLESHTPVLATTLFYRPEYGLDLLIEGLKRLKRRHPDLGCLVLGSGEGEVAARRRLREEGTAGWVHLAGDVTHDLCLALMARADLFVRPTLVDGDALSVREALGLGLPVVASDTGHRPPGPLLFPPGDADALEEALEAALGARERLLRPPPGAATGAAHDDEIEWLLRTYRELATRG